MTTLKLADFARNKGVSYITAYRWFKKGKMPENVRAYQTPSGTILVEETVKDEQPIQFTASEASLNNTISVSAFLNGMNDYTQNNASVQQFAGYVLSNFSLQLNNPQITYGSNNSLLRTASLNTVSLTNNQPIAMADVPAFDMHSIMNNSIEPEDEDEPKDKQ